MQQPDYLKEGDLVRIISTARKSTLSEIQPTKDLLESWGLVVEFGENLFQEHHQFAGSVSQRAKDLQDALDDTNVKAIICARGGYGTVQLIDEIRFEKFKVNPKWVVGYSDVTVLHNHINQNLGIETLHATMPIDIANNKQDEVSRNTLRTALFGLELSYQFKAEEGSVLEFNDISAPLFGGNLSILYSLTGTASQIKQSNYILFLEDLDEYLYHIDRMMMNLKRAGMYEGCKAVLIGGMSDMNDNTIPYGKTAKEIIKDNLLEFGIPVIFGFSAGHIIPNQAIIMGREVKITRNEQSIKLQFRG